MLTPGGPGPVIHPCGVRAGVARRVLHGLQWDAHVQQRGDEGVAQPVRVHAINLLLTFANPPGGLGKVTEQAVDGLPVERHPRRRVAGPQPPTVLAADDRAVCQEDRRVPIGCCLTLASLTLFPSRWT